MTKTELQSAVNKLSKEYGVSPIRVVFTDRAGKGLACYVTYRVKIGGKIQKRHYPRNITVYSWDKVQEHPGEVGYRVGHELAHHIQNMKKNSLVHSTAFYNLEERVARKLARMLQ